LRELAGWRRLPGGRDAEIVVHVVVVVVVDIEAIGIELADVHAVAVRVERLSASVRVTEAQGLPLQRSLYPFAPEFYAGAVFV